MDEKQLLETWEIHNRISLYLLDAVEPAALVSLSASKGRTVGEQFAHIHNVRLMWLKSAAPDLLAKLMKVEKEQAADKKLLRKCLADSGEAIKSLLSKSLREGGKVKGFKPHVTAFLGYLVHTNRISWPDHPLSQAGWKSTGQKNSLRNWEWGVR